MKFLQLGQYHAQLLYWMRFSGVCVALAGSAVAMLMFWPQASVALSSSSTYPAELRLQYGRVVRDVAVLKDHQASSGAQVVSDTEISQYVSRIQLDAASGKFAQAKSGIASLQQALTRWNQEVTLATIPPSWTPKNAETGVQLPILIYHYPPANFEEQLVHLEQAGYTTVSLDQALNGLHGGPLPAKPVVITFDDGFLAQMAAADVLVRHRMKATFYIISAGEDSHWCVGAGRRMSDPGQPAGGCGDAYLDWDHVRQLDRTGFIAIGGHTVNHRNLALLPAAEQRFEIIAGKRIIEEQLGHSIRHFAYPYGASTADSVALVREAGYVTATTTVEDSFQPAGADFALRRVRDAMVLP